MSRHSQVPTVLQWQHTLAFDQGLLLLIFVLLVLILVFAPVHIHLL